MPVYPTIIPNKPVRHQAFFDPVYTVRLEPRGQFHGVRLGESHPAVEHEFAVGAYEPAGPLYQLHILL